jgi:hypothetical protein
MRVSPFLRAIKFIVLLHEGDNYGPLCCCAVSWEKLYEEEINMNFLQTFLKENCVFAQNFNLNEINLFRFFYTQLWKN